MTALNFPPQPQDVGNTYVGGNGVTYVWDGTIWTVAGNPGSTGNVVFAGNTIATASGGNVTIQAGTEDWTFTENGTLLVPSPVSNFMFFSLDSTSYVPTEGKPALDLTGSPWQLQGLFVYGLDGEVALEINNPFPEYVNPGYDSNDTFAFGINITGIPNYTLTLTLLDVVLEGGAGWTANVAASEPPAYPPSLQSRGAVQITSGQLNYVLGADGHLVLPTNVSGVATAVTLNPGLAVGYTTANNVPTNADSGSGTGLTVDIVADGFSISSVAINQPGQGYQTGDQLQINQPGSTGNGEITVTATRSYSSMLAWPGLGNLSFDDSGSLALNVNGSVWSFNTDGSTTLPDGEPVYFGNGNALIQAGMGFHINSEEGIAITAINTGTSTNYTWGFSTDGTLYVPPGSYLKADVSSSVGLATNDGNTIAYADPSGFFIDTLYNTEEYQWQFDNQGNLTLPSGGTINFSDGSNALVGGSSGPISQLQSYTSTAGFADTGIRFQWSFNDGDANYEVNYQGQFLTPYYNFPGTPGQSGQVLIYDINNTDSPDLTWGYVTGNIRFTGNSLYDLGGIVVENADLSHAATAALILPANGSSNALTLNRLYGNVTIGTGPAGSITNTWQFDETGNLTLPLTSTVHEAIDDGVYITPGCRPQTMVITGADFVAVNLTYTYDPQADIWTPAGYNPSTDPHIEYSAGQWGIFVPGGFAHSLYINTGSLWNPLPQWEGDPPYGSVPPTGTYVYGSNSWLFGSDAALTLPDGGYIDNNEGITRLGAAGNVGVQLGSSDQQNYVTASNVGVTVQTLADTANSNWLFGLDGRTAFPHYTFQAADGTAGQMLATNGSGSVTWTTPPGPTGNANTGDLTFVGSNIASSTNADIVWQSNGFDLVFAATSNGGALTLPDYQGTGGYGQITGSTSDTGIDLYTNESSFSEVWLKPASQGGNVWISTNGETNVWDFDITGNITLPANGGIISSNAMTIQTTEDMWLRSSGVGGIGMFSGNSQLAVTGDLGIVMYGDEIGISPNDGGYVLITMYNSNNFVQITGPVGSWTFDQTGNLTLPPGGTINWSDGSNALVGGGGGSGTVNYAAYVQSANVDDANLGDNDNYPSQGRVSYTINSTPNIISTGLIVTSGSQVDTYVEGTAATGQQILTFTTGYQSTPFTVVAFVTTNAGTVYSAPATGTSGYVCFPAGTLITMADGTVKRIEDITYADHIKVWDFDNGVSASAPPIWLKAAETAHEYNLLTFSDGTTLRTVGNHHIFNKAAGRFTHTMMADTPLGTVTVNDHGEEITLVSAEVISEPVTYYNLWTEYHLNCYADGVLTSNRFNNTYPIADMKFVKDHRELRPLSEFSGIDHKWIAGLRLREQTSEHTAGYIRWYVETRLEALDIRSTVMA